MNTLKKSKITGKNTSVVEVESISTRGLWLLIQDQEYFLPFSEFPWFTKATIEQICNVEFHHGKHLHWPAIDVDLEIAAIKTIQAYPLKYKA